MYRQICKNTFFRIFNIRNVFYKKNIEFSFSTKSKTYDEIYIKQEECIQSVNLTKIDEDTIALLEHLSLVNCANKEGIKVLEDSIAFADQILHINTEGVEPMCTVLENRNLYLRNDEVTEGYCQKEILRNATVTEEDYFVAPPGNIVLPQRDNLLFSDNNNKFKK